VINTRLLILAVPVFLAGCAGAPREAPKPGEVPDAVPRQEPRSKYGNPASYEVFGKRYYVLASSAGYSERGVASWYGPGFHGKRTSSGEKYDMHAMTAAHKTLPLPCYVRVTNLANAKSVVLRVNDRGPFTDNRIIDLSRAAAERLDIIRTGTALVDVKVVEPPATRQAAAPPSPPAAPAAAATAATAKDLYIQAGAFSQRSNADNLVARLDTAGVGPTFIRRDTVNGRPLYRVRVGPVPTVAAFDRMLQDLRGVGIKDAHLALD
jgi:rare lipoprotein A